MLSESVIRSERQKIRAWPRTTGVYLRPGMGGTMKLIDESEFKAKCRSRSRVHSYALPPASAANTQVAAVNYASVKRRKVTTKASKPRKTRSGPTKRLQFRTTPNRRGTGRHSKRRALSARTRMLSANRSAASACGARGSSAMLCRSPESAIRFRKATS
jgi:hypothetical protein